MASLKAAHALLQEFEKAPTKATLSKLNVRAMVRAPRALMCARCVLAAATARAVAHILAPPFPARSQLALIEFPSLPPTCGASANAKEELIVARHTLELGALMFVQAKDMVAFERYLQRLLPYYVRDSTLRATMAPSELEFQIIGLQLLHLIVEKRLSDFHLLLELLPAEAHADQCVVFAKTIEQSMMAGNYGKVLKARGDVPDAYYKSLMEKLVDTVRAEIASCSETAYSTLPLAELQRMLMFPDSKTLLAFVATRDEWSVVGDTVAFPGDGAAEGATKLPEIPAQKLVAQVLSYATELERIV